MLSLLAVSLLLPFVNSVSYVSYFDSACSVPIIRTESYSDVCTWNTNSYSGAFSTYLEYCSSDYSIVKIFNFSNSPVCIGTPDYTINVTKDCRRYQNFYVKLLDSSNCLGANNTYNVLAHNTLNCSDGGAPFTVNVNNGQCSADSFLPSILSWDTQLYYTNNLYGMDIFASTNGSCSNLIGTFTTPVFPSGCIVPSRGFANSTSAQIWESFPVISPTPSPSKSATLSPTSSSTSSTSPTSSCSITATSSSTPSSSPHSTSIITPAIIGGTIGGTIGFGLLIISLIAAYKKSKSSSN